MNYEAASQQAAEVEALVSEVAPHRHHFVVNELGGQWFPGIYAAHDPCLTGVRLSDSRFALCDSCAQAVARAMRLSPACAEVARQAADFVVYATRGET